MSDPVSGTYRSKEEVESHIEHEDPIKILRDRMMEAELLSQAELEALDQEVRSEIDEAMEWADAQPAPEADALYAHVYAEVNEHGRLFFDGSEGR